MTIIICHNKPPKKEMELECEWRHVQKRYPWEFEDFEKTVSWGRLLKVVVEFFEFRPAEMNWDLKNHKMRRTWVEGQHSMVSICFNDLCFSPRVEGPKPEINKPVRIRNDWLRLYMYLYYCCYWYLYEYSTINRFVSVTT